MPLAPVESFITQYALWLCSMAIIYTLVCRCSWACTSHVPCPLASHALIPSFPTFAHSTIKQHSVLIHVCVCAPFVWWNVQEPPGPDEDINFYAQSLVLIGNLLYEQSQITAAVGSDGWKDMVGHSVCKAHCLSFVLSHKSCHENMRHIVYQLPCS